MNADVLTNKLPEFEFIINNDLPHIIGVNEVLPKNFKNQIFKEEFNLKNYDMLAHPNIDKNTGRGSILYIHKSLNCKPLIIDEDSNFEESIFAEINLKNNETLICGLFYRRGESSEENNNLLL